MLASVMALALADGIKEMLIDNGFSSLEDLLDVSSSDLALLLGIDLYVAKLILFAARRHAKAEAVQAEINQEEVMDAWKRVGHGKVIELGSGYQVC
jgi:hypothetical protein